MKIEQEIDQALVTVFMTQRVTKLREAIRGARLSHEKIAAATGVSKGAVTNAVKRALQKGLAWPLPAELDEARLEALMYRKPAPPERYAQPDYALVHQELKRKGVTLQLLWEEYEKSYGPSAYRYSQFCLHYHEYRGRLARSMRQVHRAGEKVFIDYSGDTVPVIDARSGEVLAAEICVFRARKARISRQGGPEFHGMSVQCS